MRAACSMGKPPGGFSGWGKVEPIEICSASAPNSSTHLHTWIESSIVLPFFSQGISALLRSSALIFTWK